MQFHPAEIVDRSPLKEKNESKADMTKSKISLMVTVRDDPVA